jgi:hypothetical protein
MTWIGCEGVSQSGRARTPLFLSDAITPYLSALAWPGRLAFFWMRRRSIIRRCKLIA